MKAMKRALMTTALGAFALSCAGDASLELDRAEVDMDAATDEMRRRMNLRLTRGEGAGAEEIELSAAELADQLRTWCQGELPSGCDDHVSYDGSNLCRYYECYGELEECVANELLNIAGDEPAAVFLAPSLGGTMTEWTVPPQSVATKAGLAAEAHDRARQSSSYAELSLRYTVMYPTYQDCGSNPTVYPADGARPAVLRQEAAATLFRSSLDLLEEAATKAHEWTLSVADAQHSDQAGIDEAAQLALLLPVGSRSEVAHRWVGGSHGLDAIQQVSEEGFCADPRLSPEGRKAEELIRISGVAPSVVMNDGVDWDHLLTNWILPRLSKTLFAEHLSSTSPEDFYEGFGLSRQAFLDARAHLDGELRAFGRDLDATIDEVPGLDPAVDPYYASIANPPTQGSRAYWAAVAGHQSFMDTRGSVPYPTPPLYEGGVAGTFDYAITQARTLASSTEIEATARDVLAEMHGQSDGRRDGRLQVCMGGGDDPTTRVRYLANEPEDGLAVVVGHAGLQCATRGTVEGAPCRLDDYRLVSEELGPATPAPTDLGFDWDHRALFAEGIFDTKVVAAFSSPVHSSDEQKVLPIFLVRLTSAAGPGGYDEVGGVMLALEKDFAEGEIAMDEYVCRTISIVPEFEEKAREAVAPSTTYCAMSSATCAGVPLDQRLPLENELIADGDAFESSWRHYLNLAREAADHADRLGEDLIRAGLEMDVRAEHATDELEDLCGVSLNVTELGAMVPPGSDPVEVAMGLLNDADQARLASCLGGEATIDWVTLGHKAMCFTWDGSQPSSICDGVSNCPSTTDEDTCPGDPATTGRAEPLAFFELTPEAEANLTRDDGDPPPCAALASLRGPALSETERETAIRSVLAHPMFSQRDRLQQYASQLGWRAYPGDYSSVTLNDGTWLGTGTYLSDASSVSAMPWPCDEPSNLVDVCPWTSLSGPNQPLFCNRLPAAACPHVGGGDPYVMTNRVARAQMNDRLARAVLAAKVIAGVPLNGFEIPYYPRVPGEPFHKVGYTDGDAPFDPYAWPEASARPISRSHGMEADTIYTSQGAVLRMDKNGDLADPVDVGVFDMGRGDLYYVANRGTAGCADTQRNYDIEWLFAPYDRNDRATTVGNVVEIFDDQPDCDDGSRTDPLYDRDLPMVVRGMDGDAATGTAVNSVLEELWGAGGGDFGGRIQAIMRNPGGARGFGPTTPGIERMTRYWRRAHTGATGLLSEFFRIYDDTLGMCFSNLVDPTDPDGCRETVGCHQYYVDCRNAMGEGEDFDSTLDGNRAFIAGQGLSSEDVLNGMELLCAAAQESSPSGYDCSDPVDIHSVGDLFGAQGFLECQADAIRNRASTMILRDMPAQVVELLGTGGTSSASGAGVSGEIAAATDELRAALIELSDTSTQIGSTVDAMGAAVGALRSRAQQMSIKAEIGQWQLASTTLNQVTQCVSKVAEAAGGMNAGAGVSAGAVCANSGAQILIANRMTSLSEDLDQEALREALYRFEQEFNAAKAGLSGADTRLRASVARIEAAITRIKNLQRRGRRALAKALMLDSSPEDGGVDGAMGRRYFVNTVMRRRMNTLRARYEDAHQNAVRTAFLAKLALEQRLGVAMDQLTDPMALIDEAPASWHMDVCSMSGIDYDRIRDSTTPPSGDREPGEGVEVPEDYAGEYLGDYVRKLAMVFESYSLDFPFQDGTDTTVLSLRDEIWNVRAACETETPNFLYEAGQLDQRASGRMFGWSIEGCQSLECTPGAECATGVVDCSTGAPHCVVDPANVGPAPDCLSAYPIEDPDDMSSDSPIPFSLAETGAVRGFAIEFGVDGAMTQSRTSETRLVQWFDGGLQPGRYRVSWYQRADASDAPLLEIVEGRDEYDEGTDTWSFRATVLPFADSAPVGPIEPNDGWARYYRFFEVRLPSQIGLAVRPQMPNGAYQRVQMAAPMVEDVTETVVGSLTESVDPDGSFTRAEASPPPLFFNTSQSRSRVQRACTDTDGSTFRETAWTRHCLGLCPDGYGDCPGALEQHCYYETSFTLDPERLQRQGILDGAGFAFGNYNYRVEQVALNVVGTNVRDCESVGGGSTCYASGNVAYSVVHDGPYPVRNHGGGLYDAPLFRGRVERARALAAERYLSNPLSGADRGLVEPYLRRELVGRPLSGTYTLRIWDDPALAWSNVEDVQLLLKYRYWTRQE